MANDPVIRRESPGEEIFLFIGSAISDAAVSKLKTGGIFYHHKMLESKVENWKKIIDLLGAPTLLGVIAKLTSRNFELMVQPEYQAAAIELIQALSETDHIVFVHDSILAGRDDWDVPPPPEWDGETPPFLTIVGHALVHRARRPGRRFSGI